MAEQTIAEAVAAYRAHPETAELSQLLEVFRHARLFVPVGDFDGHNAALRFIHAREGGEFIPLYTGPELVPEGQVAEEVGPADWLHILDQLPDVTGYAVNPYTSTNFAFTRDFVESLLHVPHDDGAVEGGEEPAEGVTPPVFSEDADIDEGNSSVLAREEIPEDTYFQIGEPARVPPKLGEAMQAVADETGKSVWLLLVVPSRGEDSYLMVIDGEEKWFDSEGADEVNAVLSRFPDPGLPLDFVIRSSELGEFVRERDPHYLPVSPAEEVDVRLAAAVVDEPVADEPVANELEGDVEGEAPVEPVLDVEPVDAPEVEDEAEVVEDEADVVAEVGIEAEADIEPEPEVEPDEPMIIGPAGAAEAPRGAAGSTPKEGPAVSPPSVDKAVGEATAGAFAHASHTDASDASPVADEEPQASDKDTASSDADEPTSEGQWAKAQEYASKVVDVGGKAAGQARAKAGELGAQVRERIAQAQAESDDAKGFIKRLFGRG